MSTKTLAPRKPPIGVVPVPLDPAVLEGPLWLRGPRPGEIAVDAAGADVAATAPGDAVTEAVFDEPAAVEAVAPVEVVRASAMRAVVGIDATIASLQAMRTHLLAGLGRLAIDEAAEAKLDAGIAIRDLASELALQQRRSDRTVEAEVGQAMDTVERWPATLRAWGDATIGRGHLAVIAEIGAPLKTPEARAAFEAGACQVFCVSGAGRGGQRWGLMRSG